MPKKQYTIKNLLWGPVTIELKKGSPITLKPRESHIVEVDDEDLDSVSFQRSLREQKVLVRESEKKSK